MSTNAQATEDEFAIIFPDKRKMEIADDLIGRIGEQIANRVLTGLWDRPILKRDVYDADHRRECLPSSAKAFSSTPLVSAFHSFLTLSAGSSVLLHAYAEGRFA